MLNTKLIEALNAQVNKEMFSAYLYMSMSAHCSENNWDGFAKWFMVQYHEEMFHAMRLYQYLLNQGAEVNLRAIGQPEVKFVSLLDLIEKTYAHEQTITKSINELYGLAVENKDYATQIFISWFVTEQVEEEKNDQEIIAKLKKIQDNSSALYLFDQEMGARALTVSTDFTAPLVTV